MANKQRINATNILSAIKNIVLIATAIIFSAAMCVAAYDGILIALNIRRLLGYTLSYDAVAITSAICSFLFGAAIMNQVNKDI